MHYKQIIERYTAREMVFKHKILLISVNRTSAEEDLYKATQYAWKVNPRRAMRADFVVATVQGLGKGVFKVSEWLDATEEKFPGRGAAIGRHGFKGDYAPEDIAKQYIGARTPEKYRKRGASNPVKYTY